MTSDCVAFFTRTLTVSSKTFKHNNENKLQMQLLFIKLHFNFAKQIINKCLQNNVIWLKLSLGIKVIVYSGQLGWSSTFSQMTSSLFL